jgi:hypothetical protein
MALDEKDTGLTLTGVTVKQVTRPCRMTDCEYCREMEIDPDRRHMSEVMNLSDRLIIMERCAFCQHFERFALFKKKTEDWT